MSFDALSQLQSWVNNFAEARFQLALFDEENPAVVYENLNFREVYADVLRSTTSLDNQTIDAATTFAFDIFRERWLELEELHGFIPASDRPQ